MTDATKYFCGLFAVGVAVVAVPLHSAGADEPGDIEVAAQAVPDSMTHQGRLVDEAGEPVTGDVELTYTIWDHATEGAVLWQEVVQVQVDDTGFYSVQIGGEDNPIDPAVLADGAGWLGVAVDEGDELEPRVSLNSVPYALVAEEALVAGEAGFAAEALDAQFADEADFAYEVGAGAVDRDALSDDFGLETEHVEGATGQTLGRLSCDSGEVARFDGNAWHCADNPQGTVTAVTAEAPLEITGPEDAPNITLPRADEQQSGYLHYSDFTSFYGRLAAVTGGEGVVVDDSGDVPELSVDFGQQAGTAVEGNDERLADARDPLPGSDHYIQNQDSTTQDADMAIDGAAAVGALDVDGDVQVDDGLTVGGTSVFGSIDVDGFASFAQGVDVTGDTDIGGDVDITGGLQVEAEAITDDDPVVLENTSTGRDGDYQTWEVSETGMYRITAKGAAGGATSRFAARRNPGAVIRGDFHLEEGDELIVLVGQRGVDGGGSAGGGGGGTFVTVEVDDSDYLMTFGDFAAKFVEPLIVAGGGAGAHEWAGGVGQAGPTGHGGQWVPGIDSSGTVSRTSGGEDGEGGESDSSASYAGNSGAGFVGDGEHGSHSDDEPLSFLNGGTGGDGVTYNDNREGGFGGGGGSSGRALGGGGGGGWSGGAGGVSAEYTGDHEETQAAGGGGGSFNDGENQMNLPGSNRGHGEVIIERIGTEGLDVASDRPGEILYTTQ